MRPARSGAPATPHGSWAGVFAVALVLIAGTLAACTTAKPSVAPSAAPTAAPQGSGGPKPTNWPTTVVEASIALGAADSDFQVVGADLATAVDAGDLQALLDVSERVQTFLLENRKNIPKLQAYDATKAVGDRLLAAYDEMLNGIRTLHDALLTGDGAGVTSGFQTFVAGNAAYSAVRADLGALAEQALFMKKHLLQ